MTELVVRTLEFGVLGLCALMVVFAAKILYSEQKREGDPRPAVFKFAYVFLGFCAFIAVLNAYVQLVQSPMIERAHYDQAMESLAVFQQREAVLLSKIEDIESALDDKQYTELQSLAASADPLIRERLTLQISRLQESVASVKSMLISNTTSPSL